MTSQLQRYRAMRDFSITPEPRGRRAAARKAKLRYYIQRHAATRLHYDFRLELEGVLKSWAVPKGPSLDPADKRLAVQTEDHPVDYGEFEGVIPEKQYGAGEVLLWDKGLWMPDDREPLEALRKGRLHFRLEGEKLQGAWVLTRTRGNEDKLAWLLIKRNDEEARSGYEITEERPESVKKHAKRSKAEVPQFVAPQLATLVTEPPKGGKWLYEVKHDGYRMLARLGSRDARLFTRSGKDWTGKLPHLVSQLKKLKLNESWLDGEIVVLREDGRASFQALQNAFERGRDAQIVYYVFDAPYLKGEDLRGLPLIDRKERLERAIGKSHAIRFSAHLEGEAREILDKACGMGLEGLIGKQAESVYASGRQKSWIKLKCRQRQDYVIAGYTPPKGSRSGFGALLLGFYDEHMKLRYAGKVGTGFDEALLSSLTKKLGGLKKPDSSLTNPPKERGIQWVKPQLVCEVTFAERTDEGILRQASFVGLREDIAPKSVGLERAQKPPQGNVVHGVKISHPERVVYPAIGFSKLDLARYYDQVAPALLPHVENRPLTLVRCPDGADKKCFYQRHLAGMGAHIHIESHGALIKLVQNGAVEFHTWGSSLPDVKHPDRITLDLDPDEELSWRDVVRATQLTRTLVDGLGLASFLKTTGGKGLHVVIPIQPKLGWEEVKAFSRLMAEFLVRAEPALFVATMAKARRAGKVFVDYLRNSETASAVAAFSARARADAGVSTPVSWDELDAKDDLRRRFTVQTVPARLAKQKRDPWAGYAKARQVITAAMRKALARP